MGSRTTSIPSFFFKYFLRVTGGERPSPLRPKRSVVTTFSFELVRGLLIYDAPNLQRQLLHHGERERGGE